VNIRFVRNPCGECIMKKIVNFRLGEEAVDALRKESQRTGKSQTGVIEDLLLWRRLFNEEAEAAMQFIAKKHKLTPRKVAEVALLKAAGLGGELPFDYLLAV
jgi:hypothetical protein